MYREIEFTVKRGLRVSVELQIFKTQDGKFLNISENADLSYLNNFNLQMQIIESQWIICYIYYKNILYYIIKNDSDKK